MEARSETRHPSSASKKGPSVQGPQGMSVQRTAKVGSPLTLTVWVSDDAKFTSRPARGRSNLGSARDVEVDQVPRAGRRDVLQGPARSRKDRASTGTAFSGKATTTVTFSQPGEYILHVVANDYSGEGGGGFPMLLDQRPGEDHRPALTDVAHDLSCWAEIHLGLSMEISYSA